jgi:hypothetical protein
MTRTRLPDGVYERLEPDERFRLTLAAVGRGDKQERERLQRTCPRKLYEMADAAVADLVHESREAAEFFTILFLRLLREVDLARARLEVERAFVDGYERGCDAALELTKPTGRMGDEESVDACADDSSGSEESDSDRWQSEVTARLRGDYQAWVAALAGLLEGFAHFCEGAELDVDELLVWSPIGLEALEQAGPHLSREIPPNETWATETCATFEGYWPQLHAQARGS